LVCTLISLQSSFEFSVYGDQYWEAFSLLPVHETHCIAFALLFWFLISSTRLERCLFVNFRLSEFGCVVVYYGLLLN